MRYCSLHHHSTFSFCDGYDLPEAHVARAAEMGMPALALTEHGNVSSHVRLEKAAKVAGVKPIFGVEAYTANHDKQKMKWHLTVLAENQGGYRNLLGLVSRGWEQFYYQPTILGTDLKEFADGLVVLSGCSGSRLATLLVGGKDRERGDSDPRLAELTASAFKELLGDRYYLEVQAFPELDQTREINGHLERLGRKLGIPLVATGDVHYPKSDDNVMQTLLHGIGRGAKTVEGASQDWEYDVRLTFYDDAEMVARLVGSGLSRRAAEEAIASTGVIAERCTVELPKVERFRYPVDDPKAEIWAWLREGWRYRRIGERPDAEKYAERVRYEMEIIEDKGFIDYFLLVSDAVRHAKDVDEMAVGPARGSVAASVVSYLLRITEVDPIVFNMLMFERFIDPNRHDIPDIDLDFDDELRWKLREYLVGKYGEERVGNIGTFTKFKGKLSLSHVGRLHGIPVPKIETVKELLVERSGGDSRADFALEDTFSLFPEAAAILAEYPDLAKAMRLEGNYMGMSTHAAGLVVASAPLTDYVAVYQREVKGHKLRAVSVDKYDAEELGIMKIDFLGLKNVGGLRVACEMLGMKLHDLYSIPLDDPETMRGFQENDVVGIFQFDGKAMRSVNAEVKPEGFMDLAAVNALSRPGPLHSGSTYEYMDVRHGRREAKELHPKITAITSWTRGQIIYQEQILQVLREVANFSWLNANKIRKVISKRLGESSFNELIGPWYEGCDANGIPRDRALEIWQRLVTAGTYAFNVAHAVSYTILGFWTMWLKRHHPQVFYVAMLRKFDDNEEKRRELLIDATRKGVKVLPPSIAWSRLTWEVEGESIRAGFEQLPGVGPVMGAKIADWADAEGRDRELDWTDLLEVKGIGEKTLPLLLKALDTDDFFGIFEMVRSLEKVRRYIASTQDLPYGDPSRLPMPTGKAENVGYEDRDQKLLMVLRVNERNLRDVFEEYRAREGHELDPEKDYYKGKMPKSMLLYCEDETGRQAVNITRKFFADPRLQELLFGLRLRKSIILVRGMKKKGFRRTLFANRIWAFNPDELGGGETSSFTTAGISRRTSASQSGNGRADLLRGSALVGFEERSLVVR